MTTTVKQFAQGQLAGSAGTLYTAPATAGNKAIVKEIVLCNDDTAAVTYTLYAVPNGQTAAATRLLFKAQSIPAGGTHVISLSLVLEASGFLSGLASSASKITYTISGTEVT